MADIAAGGLWPVDYLKNMNDILIKEMIMEHKPLPSVEASLKYMAWDMKRVANELEKLNKILEGRAHSVNDQEVPF